jgi:hypothetical protein
MNEFFSAIGISASRRRKKFNKLGAKGYLAYLRESIGDIFDDDDIDPKMSRKEVEEKFVSNTPAVIEVDNGEIEDVQMDIEESVEDISKEKEEIEEIPTWVEAVQEVLEPVVEEPVVEEPVVEEPVVEEPVVENIFSREEDIDYSSYTVRELQDVCRERGITIRGTKAEVVLRLKRHDEKLLGHTEEVEADAPSQEAVEDSVDTPSQEAVTEGENDAPNSKQGEFIDEEE